MTGPTREEVMQWAREAGGAVMRGAMANCEWWITQEQLEHIAALAFAAGARSGEDARDAATRYRVVPGEVVSVTFGDGSLCVCVDGENLLYVHGTKLHVTLGGTVRAAINRARGGSHA